MQLDINEQINDLIIEACTKLEKQTCYEELVEVGFILYNVLDKCKGQSLPTETVDRLKETVGICSKLTRQYTKHFEALAASHITTIEETKRGSCARDESW